MFDKFRFRREFGVNPSLVSEAVSKLVDLRLNELTQGVELVKRHIQILTTQVRETEDPERLKELVRVIAHAERQEGDAEEKLYRACAIAVRCDVTSSVGKTRYAYLIEDA